MANTTWNPSDKSANVTLTGSNLIATGTSGIPAGVRAVDKQVTGKFYWEYTFNVVTATGTAVGIAAGYLNLAGAVTALAAPLCALMRAGGVYADGSNSGNPAFGTIVNGTLVGIAVDLAARSAWFRLGAAGNWNNNAAYNPATGVGGVTFTSLGIGIQVYPTAWLAATSDQITANFGDSAFTGAVPAGFTSGFTAGLVSPSNELASQVAAEHWAIAIPPPMRATQAALEHWVTVNITNPQMAATQVAIEQWGTVAVITAPPVSSQVRAWIMA